MTDEVGPDHTGILRSLEKLVLDELLDEDQRVAVSERRDRTI